jgi:hypothetical protein
MQRCFLKYRNDFTLPPGYPTVLMYAFHTHAMRATCPTHPILLYMISLIILVNGTNYKATLPHCVNLSFLRVLIFSNVQIFSSVSCSQIPLSSLRMRDKISHSHKSEGKIIVFILFFTFTDGKEKLKLSLCLTKHHTMKAYWKSQG